MLHNGNNVRTYTQKGTFTSLRSVSWKYFGDFQYPEKGTSLRYEVLPLQEIFRSVLTAGNLKIHHKEQNNAFGKPARVLEPCQYLSFEC